MNPQIHSDPEKRRLYEAATKVKEMAPWELIEESALFGVQDPETGEIGFVSLMGMVGIHRAVAVYRGPRGLEGFWYIHQNYEKLSGSPEIVLETPQLQASFQDREDLEDWERAEIKRLGLKFRGPSAWPAFRSYVPGHFPWSLDPGEVRFLTRVLEQMLVVAPGLTEADALEEPPEERIYRVRVPRKTDEGLIWEDRRMSIDLPPPIRVSGNMPQELLTQVLKLQRSDLVLEADIAMSPSPVREGNGRPYYPYMLLVADQASGYLFPTKLLEPTPTWDHLWMGAAESLSNALLAANCLPRRILVKSEMLMAALEPFAQQLNIPIKQRKHLPATREARQVFQEHFGRGNPPG